MNAVAFDAAVMEVARIDDRVVTVVRVTLLHWTLLHWTLLHLTLLHVSCSTGTDRVCMPR